MSLVDELVKALLAVATLLALAPVTAWLHQRVAASPPEPETPWARVSRGLADALRQLARPAPATGDADAGATVERLAAVAPLLAFAWVPFGGVYAVRGGTLDLVVADADWGIQALFLVGALSLCGLLLADWAGGAADARAAALRRALRLGTYGVAAALSVLGAILVFETWRLQPIAVAQEGTLRAFAWLEPIFGAAPAWLDGLRLPAWGVFRQPLGFALCLVLAGLAARAHRGHPARSRLRQLSGLLWTVVIAATTSTLFLGGWSLPYLPTATLQGAAAGLAGPNIALGVCVLLHFAAFVAKLVFVVWLQTAVTARLPAISPERALRLCWQVVVPLALANGVATAWLLASLRSAT